MPPPISPLVKLNPAKGRHVTHTSRLLKVRGQMCTTEVKQEGTKAFWCQKQNFHRKAKFEKMYMPHWDRAAIALILFTKNVLRVPQEAAFRLLAVHLKIMMLPVLAQNVAMRLPGTMSTMKLEALMAEAKNDPSEVAKEESSSSGSDKK